MAIISWKTCRQEPNGNGEEGEVGEAKGMGLTESDTRAKLIDPAIHARGWTEDLIRREETAGAIEIIDGKPRKQAKGRVDYALRIKVNLETQPVAVALRYVPELTWILFLRILDEQQANDAERAETIEEELDAINKLPAALLRRAFSGGL